MKMLLNEFIVFKATTYYIRADLVLWNRCNKFLVGHYFIINNNIFFGGGMTLHIENQDLLPLELKMNLF
jgi:hypothetical protein